MMNSEEFLANFGHLTDAPEGIKPIAGNDLQFRDHRCFE